MVPRWSAWVVPVLFAAGVSAEADAGMVSFIAQIQTNTGEFQITNLSDDGFQLTGLNIQLGSNTEFQAPPLSLSGITDEGALLTFSPALASAILDGGTSAAISFTGFDPNDVWGFTTGFVDRLDSTVAMGADMNNALITATFSNGQILMATFNGAAAGNRKAFTFSGSAEASVAVLQNPEPSSVMLLLIGGVVFGGMAAVRRRHGRRTSLPDDVAPS